MRHSPYDSNNAWAVNFENGNVNINNRNNEFRVRPFRKSSRVLLWILAIRSRSWYRLISTVAKSRKKKGVERCADSLTQRVFAKTALFFLWRRKDRGAPFSLLATFSGVMALQTMPHRCPQRASRLDSNSYPKFSNCNEARGPISPGVEYAPRLIHRSCE